jgi:hypothetical protein
VGDVNSQIKAAIIIAIGLIGAVGLWLYFSPYQSCVRAEEAEWRAAPTPNMTSDADIVNAAHDRCASR